MRERTFRIAALVALSALAACSDEASELAADAGDAGDVSDVGDVGSDVADVSTDAGHDGTDAADAIAHDSSVDADSDVATDVAADVATDATDVGPEPDYPDCDPLDPTLCALPWPSNLYLVDDASTETGYRLQLGDETMPRSRSGRRMEPERFTHLDGYGLGTPIMTQFANLSLEGVASEQNIGLSVEEASPTLLLKVTEDGAVERVPHWVELDATVSEDEVRLAFLRAAVILEPDTRYVVAFRNLVDAEGAPIEASPAFASLRSGVELVDPELAPRVARFEEVFAFLEDAGVSRDSSLVLAWDFHTASNEALHGRLDRAISLGMAELGDGGAELTVDDGWSYTRDGSGETESDDEIAHVLEMTMTSPAVVNSRGENLGWELNLDAAGEIQLAEELPVRVRVYVPHVAVEGQEVGVIVYGHGLLGDEEEVGLDYLQAIADSEKVILVACPMMGMSAYEATAVLLTTFDMNNFVTISDGLIQGIMQTHVLARTAIRTLEPTLATEGIEVDIDPDRLFWWGGSQGGIFGATILATSPDIDRGGLAVPGNNYSTMLQRSVNFELYFEQLRENYAPGAATAVLIAGAQLLWDSTDPVSYWHRLVGRAPFDDRPRQALLLVAKGDKQVAVVTNEVLARTFPEVALMAGYDERLPWGVEEVAYPHTGTGIVLFDFGNAWPDGRANRPPEDVLPDPHSRLDEVTTAAPLIHSFLESGTLVDVCGGDGCNPE